MAAVSFPTEKDRKDYVCAASLTPLLSTVAVHILPFKCGVHHRVSL